MAQCKTNSAKRHYSDGGILGLLPNQQQQIQPSERLAFQQAQQVQPMDKFNAMDGLSNTDRYKLQNPNNQAYKPGAVTPGSSAEISNMRSIADIQQRMQSSVNSAQMDRVKQFDRPQGILSGMQSVAATPGSAFSKPPVPQQPGIADCFGNSLGAIGFKDGGKIKGPGTPTSDSIDAEIQQTGEPIKVSTGERILSKKQDDLMQSIAQGIGFDNLDSLLEAGTGRPVGPTMKGGKRAAAGGWGIGRSSAMGTPKSDTQIAAELAAAQQPIAAVASSEAPPAVRPWYAGTDSRDIRSGLEMERGRRVEATQAGTMNDPVKSALMYGVTGGEATSQVAKQSTPAQATYSNEGRSAPVPTAGAPLTFGPQDETFNKENGVADTKVVGTSKFSDPQGKAFDAYAKAGMNTVKLSNGQSAILGQSAADAARDKQFAEAGYGKDAGGNWMTPQRIADQQALAKMQRENAVSDARYGDPRRLAAMVAGERSDMAQQSGQLDIQGKQMANEQVGILAGLQKGVLAGDQKAIEQIGILNRMNDKRPEEFIPKVVSRPDPSNHGQNIEEVVSVSNRTGLPVKAQPQKAQSFTKADVDKAIAEGASKEAVAKRIKDSGFDPKQFGL